MCQTPLYGHWLRTCCTTPPTDKLTTILQLVVQQINYQLTKICRIPTSWYVEMLGFGIAMWQIFDRWWQICCTTSCRIAVSSSVGVRSRCPCSGVLHYLLTLTDITVKTNHVDSCQINWNNVMKTGRNSTCWFEAQSKLLFTERFVGGSCGCFGRRTVDCWFCLSDTFLSSVFSQYFLQHRNLQFSNHR